MVVKLSDLDIWLELLLAQWCRTHKESDTILGVDESMGSGVRLLCYRDVLALVWDSGCGSRSSTVFLVQAEYNVVQILVFCTRVWDLKVGTIHVTILLSRTKNLLPGNPCSIAAQARLSAESQLLSLMPGAIGHLTNKQLATETLFVDHMFSLGWWGVDDREIRRFGFDVGQSSVV
jgi:hypothetical protein